jgi:hypothetical protein
MSKSEHEAKAREFLDSILKVNKQHGVSGKSAIKYDVAVKAAAKTPRRLQESRTMPTRKSA